MSLFVQLTVVPLDTVLSAGEKAKSLMEIVAAGVFDDFFDFFLAASSTEDVASRVTVFSISEFSSFDFVRNFGASIAATARIRITVAIKMFFFISC